MQSSQIRVVLNSNILISSYVFGGNSRKILRTIISEKAHGITSPPLMNEFYGVLRKKFQVTTKDLQIIQEEIHEVFEVVHPLETITIVRDADDNRVLEAAVEGKVRYIITGDNDLLDIKNFRTIEIISANDFLNIIETL